MKLVPAAASLDYLTAQIKLKMVENEVLTNANNAPINKNSIEIGAALSAAKKLVKHGQFQTYLQENFDMAIRTAQRYMKLDDLFGVNSPFKCDIFFQNVVFLKPTALLELAKLAVEDVRKFLSDQASAGVDFSTIKLPTLRERIKEYRADKVLTLDVEAVIADAPKKRPQKYYLPAELLNSALRAGFTIALEFSRAAKITAAVVVTKMATGADFFQAFMAAATAGVMARPLKFPRTDGTAAKLKTCIWYFGSDTQAFTTEFSRFGNVFAPIKEVAALQAPMLNFAENRLVFDFAAAI